MTEPAPAQRWRLEVLWSVSHGLRDARLERMAAEADAAEGWFVTRTRGGFAVAAQVTTDRPDVALGRFATRVQAWVRRYAHQPQLVALHARTEAEALADMRHPDVPPLAGVADAAQILGVTRERVQRWRTEKAGFPAPVARTAAGPLWTVAALRHFGRRLRSEAED